MTTRRSAVVLLALSVALLAALGGAAAPRATSLAAGTWRDDPAWHAGKAEWAVYDAARPIYGAERRYEATLFTNKQRMDPETGTKAGDWRDPDAIEVFKHNLSEMIPTAHYTYRFLTTCFVRTDDLRPVKVAMSSQEDCGTTYKQFVVADGRVRGDSFCYFPGAGAERSDRPAPPDLAFHDALSLTLRDFPFGAPPTAPVTLKLVPDQTDTHATGSAPVSATVAYVARETLRLPYGPVDAHHLRVTHPVDGGRRTTDYWFAADPALRHVMVRYEGPYGVRYELKKLGWWAYWNQDEPAPQ